MKIIFMLLFYSCITFAQTDRWSPNAPPDKPFSMDSLAWVKMDKAIQPYVEIALKTYPKAKARFIKGLPEGYAFFVTTRLKDFKGRIEQVFIFVNKINNDYIDGIISSPINIVSGYKPGQRIKVKENQIVDWMIANPDGSEEGNFVGKFLDTYQDNQ